MNDQSENGASGALVADYSLTPTAAAAMLIKLVSIRQPTFAWGAPGVGKSMVMRAVAEALGMEYVDVRALMLDPVDLRGIPWRDGDRTRWAPPAFLPPSDSKGKYLVNLEELVSAPPMVQAALYQLVLDRKCGEYELPPGAAVVACGNRASDRGVVHRMPTPLASRFTHIDFRVDQPSWAEWAIDNDIAAEVIFFTQMRPDLLHDFDPQSKEHTFSCPRTWEFVSKMLESGIYEDLSAEHLRAGLRGTIGTGAAVEFSAFLKIWRSLPHPQAILSDPHNAEIPENASTLLALCGAIYRLADDTNFDSVVVYASRLRQEVGEFMIGSAVRANKALQSTAAYIKWAAHIAS